RGVPATEPDAGTAAPVARAVRSVRGARDRDIGALTEGRRELSCNLIPPSPLECAGLTFHNSRFVADAAVRHRFALQSLQARTNVTSPARFPMRRSIPRHQADSIRLAVRKGQQKNIPTFRFATTASLPDAQR